MANQQSNPAFHVLLAVDGSEHSLAAIAFLNAIVLPKGSSITAITVLTPKNAYRHTAFQAMLEQARSLLDQTGADIVAELKLGYPAEVVNDYASQHRPDLIVLGAKGLRATLGILLGGVAQQVVEYSSCPVLVVRAPFVGLSRVLLVTDGSPHSQKAVEYLMSFPLPRSVDLRVMHVLPPMPPIESLTLSWPISEELLSPLTPELVAESELKLAEEEAEGQVLLDRTVSLLGSTGIPTSGVLSRGDAATEIIRYAGDNRVDLIVAGSRGLSRVQGWLLGSVTRKLVHYASCSTLIYKSPVEPGS